MHRMVTKEDLERFPQLQKQGVSVNQHYDFTHLIPQQPNYSNSDYDISEYTPVDYGNFKPKPKDVKKWTKAVSKIFVINLAKRKDRMLQAVQQLNKYSIPFERVDAIPHEKGAEGLRLTMEKLFKDCIKKKYENVLLLEDDLDIIEPKINEILTTVMANLPPNYDIIYLGCNLCTPPQGYYSNNLLSGVTHAFATHAAIYSLKAMKTFVKPNGYAPVDNFIVEKIQPQMNCYAVTPMLISQIVSHSDIYSDVPEMDWRVHLQLKFPQMVAKVKDNR